VKRFLICILIVCAMVSGCGNSEKNDSENQASAKQESQSKESSLYFFGVKDDVVRFSKLDKHVNDLNLKGDVSAIARDGERFWAGCKSGTLHEIEIAGNYADTLDTLKIAGSFEIGCKISILTPTPGRLWVTYKDCETKQPTIAEFDTEARQVVARHVIVKPNDSIEQVLAKDKQMYVLAGNAFSLIRFPTGNPAEQQVLDLREGATGKYGHGDAAFVGDQLWVLDSTKQQLMNIDVEKFSLASMKPLDGFGATFETSHCIGGEKLLYCWLGENILALDPNGNAIKGTHTAEYAIKHAAVINGDVYIGYLGTITQLAGADLNPVKENPSYYGYRFIGVLK
jgi:hypothetical protein